MNEDNIIQGTLFDMEKEDTKAKIHDVTFYKRLYSQPMTYLDIFNGYNYAYIITYSYTLSMIRKIIDKYDFVQIILGNRNIVKKDALSVIAYQGKQIDYLKENVLKNNHELLDYIKEGRLKLHIANGFISHEKIFLLFNSENSKKRVVKGSANFTERALNSNQREVIDIVDGDEEYEILFSKFQDYINECTDEVLPKVFLSEKDNTELTDIPIIDKAIKNKLPLLISDDSEEVDANIIVEKPIQIGETKKLKEEYKELLGKRNKKGFFVIDPLKIIPFCKKLKKEKNQREIVLKELYPNLLVDYQNETIHYKGTFFELQTNPSDVITDINAIVSYFEGFNNTIGDVYNAKRKYFKALNYFFLSPFLGILRYKMYKHDSISVDHEYPMFICLWGQRSSGKTSFIKMCQKAICGEEVSDYQSNMFTKTGVLNIMQDCKGMPVLIDEVSRNMFNRNSPMICKMDYSILKEKIIHQPTIVITSNDIGDGAIKQDIVKRMIVIHCDNGFLFEDTHFNAKTLKTSIDQIKNNFFLAYCSKMFPKIELMLNEIDTNQDKKTYPDIFKASCDSIFEVFTENNVDIPSYFTALKYSDYMNDEAVSETVINQLKNYYKYDSKRFKRDQNHNRLIFQCNDNREARKFAEELPKDMEAKSIQDTLYINNLDVAEEKYFKMKLKRRLFF